MITDLQTCFSEFRFAPYTGLGAEWVQLGLEGSWNGALLCGYGGEHVAPAQLVRLGWCLAWRMSQRCHRQPGQKAYNVPKTVLVSEGKMALVPFGYAKRC